ncbi:MAG: hypothetical protein FJX47_11335 [Alphaproteobacteria bacterium]|nr:hypothetical protein [Alphaproteobacteria bacterium]
MIRSLVILAGVALMAAPALAQQPNVPKSIGSFDAWGAFVHAERGQKTCYAASKPIGPAAADPKRPPPYVMVTFRNGAKPVSDEVSVFAGYAFKRDMAVTARIGQREFSMFAHGDSAWNRDSASDRAMIQAMRSGKDLTVNGMNARDQKVSDGFSLMGFAKAYDAVVKECRG